MEHIAARILHPDILQGKCNFQTIGETRRMLRYLSRSREEALKLKHH